TNRSETRKRKYDKAKHKGLLQYWTGHLTVKVPNDKVISQQKEKLRTRGTKEFKQLYRICMTDASFKERELKAPGYLGGIYIYSRLDSNRSGDRSTCPRRSRRDPKAGVGRQGRHSVQVLLSPARPAQEALKKDNHHVSACWINTLYDNYEQTLLRSDKQKNVITRETILEVLGKTEENIKKGLTIKEVLPLFEKKYKLKLRVYDVFCNLIHKYDPEVPN
ncbi:MAG: hypothetical protein ACKPKO_38290, partial [Candidatus Fonsibacter sp.]